MKWLIIGCSWRVLDVLQYHRETVEAQVLWIVAFMVSVKVMLFLLMLWQLVQRMSRSSLQRDISIRLIIVTVKSSVISDGAKKDVGLTSCIVGWMIE